MQPGYGPQILGGFRGSIEPIPVTPGYRLSLFLAAMTMLILPALYVVLVLGIAGAAVYHGIAHTGLLKSGLGWAMYLAPLLLAPIVVLFLVKPFFARSPGGDACSTLLPQNEPLLFAFVARVCQAVGAPPPDRIDVDMQCNASAGFSSTFGGQLVLTIGAPLAAGMSVQQLSGVLAHEFGHFSQEAGMQVSYFVRIVSMWLTRVVYERDVWDLRLLQLYYYAPFMRLILLPATLVIGLSRCFLWVLMMTGHLVSGNLLRQMEYDADRHETRFAGTPTFEHSTIVLKELNMAMELVEEEFFSLLFAGRFANDLPRLVVARALKLSQLVRGDVWRKIVEEDRTIWSLFSSHPLDRDRIQAAREENAPGVFYCPLPAAALFSNLDAISMHLTWDFYRSIFGRTVPAESLVPVEQLVSP